jgi:hypothetical protein
MEAPQPSAILKSNDIPATVDWYRRIGFTLTGRHPESEPTWVELARDGLVVQFVTGDTPWPGPPAFTGCLYVHPESVQAVYERISQDVACPWGVETRPWGARELTLEDPNGYLVTFTEPLVADP